MRTDRAYRTVADHDEVATAFEDFGAVEARLRDRGFVLLGGLRTLDVRWTSVNPLAQRIAQAMSDGTYLQAAFARIAGDTLILVDPFTPEHAEIYTLFADGTLVATFDLHPDRKAWWDELDFPDPEADGIANTASPEDGFHVDAVALGDIGAALDRHEVRVAEVRGADASGLPVVALSDVVRARRVFDHSRATGWSNRYEKMLPTPDFWKWFRAVLVAGPVLTLAAAAFGSPIATGDLVLVSIIVLVTVIFPQPHGVIRTPVPVHILERLPTWQGLEPGWEMPWASRANGHHGDGRWWWKRQWPGL